MRLPRLDPRPGESAREHVERVGYSRVHPVWMVVRVLVAYVVRLLDRVDALERRVAELERRGRQQ